LEREQRRNRRDRRRVWGRPRRDVLPKKGTRRVGCNDPPVPPGQSHLKYNGENTFAHIVIPSEASRPRQSQIGSFVSRSE
jgi:hypothetical protein